MDQGADLFAAQALIVMELAHGRIGAPRWHALGAQHFADHRREALDTLIVGQGHGADATGLVTGDALGLNDRCDVVGVGHLGGSDLAVARYVDQATFRILPRHLGGVARQEGGQGIGGPGLGRLGALALIGHAIIDGAAIDHLPGLGLDDDDLGGAGHAQLFTNQLIAVQQDRQVIAIGLGLGQNLFARVGGGGVQHHELNALAREGRHQRLHGGAGIATDGAAVLNGDDHHGRGIAHPIEFFGQEVLVGQTEIIDLGWPPRCLLAGHQR